MAVAGWIAPGLGPGRGLSVGTATAPVLLVLALLAAAATAYCLGSEMMTGDPVRTATALRYGVGTALPWAGCWALHRALPGERPGWRAVLLPAACLAAAAAAAAIRTAWLPGQPIDAVALDFYRLLPVTLPVAAGLWLLGRPTATRAETGAQTGAEPGAAPLPHAPLPHAPLPAPAPGRRGGEATADPGQVSPPPPQAGTAAAQAGDPALDLAWPDGHPVRAREISHVTAAGNYVEVWRGRRSVLWRRTLTEVEQILAPAGFLRVHRGALVRTDALAGLHRAASGALAARLSCGATVPVGRSHRDEVRRRLPRTTAPGDPSA